MKLSLLARLQQNNGELITRFGDARHVKKLTGKIELLGGTDIDRAEAETWCLLFKRNAVAACLPCRHRAPAKLKCQILRFSLLLNETSPNTLRVMYRIANHFKRLSR